MQGRPHQQHVTKGCVGLSFDSSCLWFYFNFPFFYPLCFVPLVRSPHFIFLFFILCLLCPVRSPHLRFSFYLPVSPPEVNKIIYYHFFIYFILSCCVLWNIGTKWNGNEDKTISLWHHFIISYISYCV